MNKIISTFIFLLTFTIFNSYSADAANHSGPKMVCSGGFTKWIKGELKELIKPKCITEQEYQAYLNAPDYQCKYYLNSIWKESEREYGKKQYKWSEGSLEKIKSLKDQGKSLCDKGKLKEGEAKLKEAIKIISHTMMN